MTEALAVCLALVLMSAFSFLAGALFVVRTIRVRYPVAHAVLMHLLREGRR